MCLSVPPTQEIVYPDPPPTPPPSAPNAQGSTVKEDDDNESNSPSGRNSLRIKRKKSSVKNKTANVKGNSGVQI